MSNMWRLEENNGKEEGPKSEAAGESILALPGLSSLKPRPH